MPPTTDLDRVARSIAANAGVTWESLNDYPGYIKNIWREQAQMLIAAVAPPAEPRGRRDQ